MTHARWRLALAVAAVMLGGCEGCQEKTLPETPNPVVSADAGASSTVGVAQLSAAHGEVSLTRDGTTAPAQPGPLRLHDVVETGAGAGAEVRFSDGRTIGVGENARFVLDEQAGALVLSLAQGTLISRVAAEPARGPSVRVNVQTPYGLTRLGQGAQDVEVAVDAKGGRVDVKLGQVELLDKDGKAQTAKAGDRLEASAGKVELVSRTPVDQVDAGLAQLISRTPQDSLDGGVGSPDILSRTPQVLTLQPIKVVVQGGPGVQVRQKGASLWRNVSGSQPVAEGSSIRTARSAARLLLGDAQSSLELGPSSEVLFTQSGKRGDREQAQLELRRGKLTQLSRNGAPATLIFPDLTVEGDAKGNRYDIARKGQALHVRAIAGDLALKKGEKEETLIAGTQTDAQGDGFRNNASLEQASLKISGRGQRIYQSGLQDVTLSWPGETGDYHLMVAEDPAFEKVLVEGQVHKSRVTVPLPRKGALYWKVKNADGSDTGGSAIFAPENGSDELQSLRNGVRDGAEKTSIYFQDKPPAVTFNFNPVEGAAKYKLAVFSITELTNPLREKETTDSSVRLEEGALAEGNYVWSVTPLKASGEALPTRGKMNRLELVYDNNVAALKILSPRNGEASRDQVRAVGIAPLHSRVYINGKPVALDEKGRFETTTQGVGSPPLVIFKLSRPGEADSLTVRTLR